MSRACKPWCGVHRMLPYSGRMGRTWCRKKCRDRYEREHPPRQATSVMQAFEMAYGPLGRADDVN